MANGIIVTSFNPCTRKIAVDGIRRQYAYRLVSYRCTSENGDE